jgi:cell division protein FtsB
MTDAADLPKLTSRRPERRWVPALLLFVAAVVLVDALIGDQSFASGRQAQEKLLVMGAELSVLQGENARLREEIRRLQDDPDTIEYLARKDLGLARKGEVLVLLGRGEARSR